MKFFLFLLFIGCSIGFGQVAVSDGPYAWLHPSQEIEPSFRYLAKGFDLQKIELEDAANDLRKDGPWRFGYAYTTDIEPSEESFHVLPNGDRLWSCEISCPDALTINLLFENYKLPQGARLHLYDSERTNFVGAYTSANNRPDGALGTELVHGSSIVVEYVEPAEAEFTGTFKISSVIHGYRSLNPIQAELEKALNDSGDCHHDVECTLGNGWEDEIRAVAMIIVNGNGVCTGALINNACEDGRPLFLSANHCLTSNTSNWAFRFNWKTAPGSEACGTSGASIDPGPPYDETANGATVLSNGAEADFLLMELDQLSPANILDWNLFFAGWDRTDNESLTNGTVIHHPKADVMKISFEADAPYHNTISNTAVWWIDQYEQGVTEIGSSGAPLFDQNHRIVGQLYGGTASCSGTNPNGNSDYYGRLGIAWENGLDTLLGSLTCGFPQVMDGWEPDAPDVFDDANLQFVSAPGPLTCSGKFIPEVVLRNAGDNNLTSCVLHYSVDGGTELTQNWSGNLLPNASETIQFPQMAASNGTHFFTAYSDQPNGTVDNNTVNDTAVVDFTLAHNTAETHILIETDCYGYETSWELLNASNVLIASGGNPNVAPGGNQTAASSDLNSYANEVSIDEMLCLTEGCYTFVIYDDWGDGLEGSTQFGCDVDGTYTITDEAGTVGSLQNVAFGDSESIDICVQQVSIDELNSSSITLYPNPSSDVLNIAHSDGKSILGTTYTIVDVTGKLIEENLLLFPSISIAALASGNYFLSIEGVTKAPIKFVVSH